MLLRRPCVAFGRHLPTLALLPGTLRADRDDASTEVVTLAVRRCLAARVESAKVTTETDFADAEL